MKTYQKKITGWMILSIFILGFGLTGCQPKSKSSSQEKIIYQCSMHPQVISDKPGNCPICGMRLTKIDPQQKDKEVEENKVSGHAGLHISAEQQQLIGMKTTTIEERPLTVRIRTLGRIGYDPEKFQAIAEYQEAAVAFRNFRGNPSSQVKEKTTALHELAMLKLRLAGFSDPQIEGLTRTGQLVAHYSLAPDVHWLYADIYENESQLVHAGDKVEVKAPSLPGRIFTGTVRSIDAVLNASNRILRARIELEPLQQTLLPGATVDVEIQASLGIKLAVPEDAVVDTGEQQIVFVTKEDGSIEPRSIQIGYEADGYYEVLSGIEKNENVVSSATFLVDSESRLRAARSASSPKTKVEEGAHRHD